jgi:hypothetical protein
MSDVLDLQIDVARIRQRDAGAEQATSRLNQAITSLSSQYVSKTVRERGRLITFYSYKGGVGRSRALANVGVQLAVSGRSVLCVDFDLEAPGLSSYLTGDRFAWSIEEPDMHPGLIDLFCSYRDNLFRRVARPVLKWTDMVRTVNVTGRDVSGTLDFLGPGSQGNSYKQEVSTFDWRSFYEHWDGGTFIEQLRTELLDRYQYVLVDSRTGITDISGICTVHLPDILVAVFTPGPQSQRGLVDALKSIEANRKDMWMERPLPIVPLPCRVDRDVAREDYDGWFKRLLDSYFAEKVTELGLGLAQDDYFRRVSIEHFSRYVYDDAIESLEHHVDDEAGNAWKYRNLVSVLESTGPVRLSAAALGLREGMIVERFPSLVRGSESRVGEPR